MIISTLELSDFRSYSKRKFLFPGKNTLFLAPNAYGKTNILEALFLLSTGKSFRAEATDEMMSFHKDLARVKGTIDRHDEKSELEIVLTKGMVMDIKTPMKKYSVNGVGKRMIDYIGVLKTVLFWPEDLELVTDSPSKRRKYIDFVLMQTDREYRRCLQSYERGIRQRNRILEAIRDNSANKSQLFFWDQLVIKTGEYITKKREEYIEYINRIQNSNLGIQNYQLIYDKSIISRDRLDQYGVEELAAGVTLVGPHRDDVEFRIQNSEFRKTHDDSDSRNLSHFGSRGEQRLAILWLKLGELAYIKEITGEKPVLLLDDIFSELDHKHREIIFDVIGNQQTIMTTTDLHLIDKRKMKDVEIVELS